ncbi:TPA: thiol reductase thioredoxin [Streptococcus suis]|uniref:thiol reductase thioredoxin n=1 Tax=Streptococcus suis TaxID=1307 RepID=UPI00207CB0BB|nr:thiol reductase thioredoxin [Streptococcus suis]MCO0825832.1 thiol reductase thioredoxin [Streptococcus suis]MCO0827866.1 thiol reductase thioredoxin [Streptococcus suis]MCO0846351.1 thiol reductase thioredoxin [Streptococcus suis]MCO0853903.1 thiol reductase thioredoxin [Streptococcus suis]MDW8641330.1 thiol reductase thioredoxin [Streptococcus suis]
MNFQDYIQDFTSVTAEQAQNLLAAQDKQVTVHFLDSSQISSKLQALRDHYQVPTVPGLLVAKSTGVQVRCDSSMTEEEIAAFIQD